MSTWFVESPPGKYDDRGRYPMTPELEEQFEILFEPNGEPPVRPGPNPERAAWEDAKKNFRGITAPEGIPLDLLQKIGDDYEAFDLGRPVFYRHAVRGILGRIDGAPIDVNPDATTIIANPGQTIAAIQTRRIKQGEHFAKLHWYVTAKYQKMNDDNAK